MKLPDRKSCSVSSASAKMVRNISKILESEFKKLASLALAGTLSFSLAAPTFAAGNETEITGQRRSLLSQPKSQ